MDWVINSFHCKSLIRSHLLEGFSSAQQRSENEHRNLIFLQQFSSCIFWGEVCRMDMINFYYIEDPGSLEEFHTWSVKSKAVFRLIIVHNCMFCWHEEDFPKLDFHTRRYVDLRLSHKNLLASTKALTWHLSTLCPAAIYNKCSHSEMYVQTHPVKPSAHDGAKTLSYAACKISLQ